ncbi:MAG TPA: 50S ribosomal protein L25 [bacterium]|nr:50S ribosomal protein L25 [bacterium]
MKRVSLQAEKREVSGKGGARKLRSTGRVPAIIYGNEVPETLHIALDSKVLIHSVKPHEAHNFIVDLEVEKTVYPTIIAEIQQDPVTEEPLHVDFYRISMNKPIHTTIPIILSGSSPGVKEGGMLEHTLREINISCLPGNLPDSIEVDVSNLDLDESIHVSDLAAPSGVEFITEVHDTVVHVRRPRLITEEEAAVVLEGEEAPVEGEEGAAEEEAAE